MPLKIQTGSNGAVTTQERVLFGSVSFPVSSLIAANITSPVWRPVDPEQIAVLSEAGESRVSEEWVGEA